MITLKQRKVITSVLKRNWADDVLTLLKRRKISNIHGKQYSKESLRQVLYNRKENQDIECAILDVYEQTLNTNRNLSKRKESLLSI